MRCASASAAGTAFLRTKYLNRLRPQLGALLVQTVITGFDRE
jgi:hypothetical protein